MTRRDDDDGSTAGDSVDREVAAYALDLDMGDGFLDPTEDSPWRPPQPCVDPHHALRIDPTRPLERDSVVVHQCPGCRETRRYSVLASGVVVDLP
jgi:hypothetical protein